MEGVNHINMQKEYRNRYANYGRRVNYGKED